MSQNHSGESFQLLDAYCNRLSLTAHHNAELNILKQIQFTPETKASACLYLTTSFFCLCPAGVCNDEFYKHFVLVSNSQFHLAYFSYSNVYRSLVLVLLRLGLKTTSNLFLGYISQN